MTKLLLRQAYFCCDKRVCHDKTFAATKMVLVAAPTNEMQHPPVNTVQLGDLMECSVATEHRAKS